MLRFFALICSSICFAVSAQACDMATSKRASQVADYVEKGRLCLKTPDSGFHFDTQMEIAFVAKINQERTKRGLKPLNVRREILPAARFHSLDMGVNNFFGHDSPRGRDHRFRLTAFDRTGVYSMSAENVAKSAQTCTDGYNRPIPCREARGIAVATPSDVVTSLHRQLMNSPGHRRNILDPRATHVAVGVARGNDGFYVTQLFAEPVGRLARPLPLRAKAGTRLTTNASLSGWSVVGLAYARDGSPTHLTDKTLPMGLRGDVSLRVHGENRTVNRDGGRTSETIMTTYPDGPMITVLPATGS